MEDGFTSGPREDVMSKLAEVLKYPKHFFYQKGERAACPSFYRKKSTLSMRQQKIISARMNIRLMHIEALVKAADFETKPLPRLDPDEIEGGAPQIAKQIRYIWGVPRGPLADAIKTAEDAGCIVVLFDFETRQIDGLSLYTDSGMPIIFINRDIPVDRMRFTVIHELGHLIMHHVPTPDMETDANEFAAEFLMPENDITSSLYPLNVAQLARLKLYWKVSMASILKRAQDLGAITERYARYLWMQMGPYRSKEPHSEQLPKEEPTLLRGLIQFHLSELEYTVDEILLPLALLREEFENIYMGRENQTQLMA